MDRSEISGTEAGRSKSEQDDVMAISTDVPCHDTDPCQQQAKLKFGE
jgi:hypothetical protein